MLNVAVPRVLMCANFVDAAIPCSCPGCEAMSRRRVTAQCQLLLRREMALDKVMLGVFKQTKAVYIGRCGDIFSLAHRSEAECDNLVCTALKIDMGGLDVVKSLATDTRASHTIMKTCKRHTG